MKKKLRIFFLFSLILILVGCEGLKTPEELIGPPEIDVEKKMISDIIRRFLPVNSEILIIPQGRNTFSTEPMVRSNIDTDEEEEIVALYRDKNMRKIGMLVIDEKAGVWSNALELKIDAFEVSDYAVIDLNGDGKSEILFGYFSVSDPYKELMIFGDIEGKLRKIYETKYLALDLNNTNQNDEVEIALSTIGNSDNNNKLVLLNYREELIQKVGELVYAEDAEIYKIFYSNINRSNKAYFIDMYTKEGIGKSDLVSYSNQDLFSLLRKNGIAEIVQEIPTTSSDTDGDGVTELIANKILEQNEGVTRLVLRSCYNFNINKELELQSKEYEDYELGIAVVLQYFIDNKISVAKMDEHLRFYYFSEKEDKKIEFLDIVKTDAVSANEYRLTHTLIDERNDQVILAKLSSSDELKGAEKNQFEKLYQSLHDMKDIIRFIE